MLSKKQWVGTFFFAILYSLWALTVGYASFYEGRPESIQALAIVSLPSSLLVNSSPQETIAEQFIQLFMGGFVQYLGLGLLLVLVAELAKTLFFDRRR